MQNFLLLNIGFVIVAYLLGSFSSAITLSHIMGFPDPRSEGSNNPGATNVMRIAGKKAAAMTLFGDLLKGFLPVLVAQYFLTDTLWVALTGLAAFIGHCYPIYYRFSGGKGVATAFGFILAFHWLSCLATGIIWLIVAKVFKLSSLAAMIAFSFMPLIYFMQTTNLQISILLALLSLMLILRHKENIRRMIQGVEK